MGERNKRNVFEYVVGPINTPARDAGAAAMNGCTSRIVAPRHMIGPSLDEDHHPGNQNHAAAAVGGSMLRLSRRYWKHVVALFGVRNPPISFGKDKVWWRCPWRAKSSSSLDDSLRSACGRLRVRIVSLHLVHVTAFRSRQFEAKGLRKHWGGRLTRASESPSCTTRLLSLRHSTP